MNEGIATRQLGENRWEAFYLDPERNSDDWDCMEGATEEEAIKNVKERYGK